MEDIEKPSELLDMVQTLLAMVQASGGAVPLVSAGDTKSWWIWWGDGGVGLWIPIDNT